MAKLEAMLEQRGLATAREVSEAVARCQLHGGDLTTSLLQFMSADESLLSATLSECYGLPTAAVGALPVADDGALRSLPRDVAERYCCFPLEASPGRLVLAVAQPLEPSLKEELGATLGVVIEERVALEVRIRQALSRSYGLPLSARNQRGIARLEGDLDGAAHEPGLWPETQLSAVPRSPSELPPSHRDSPRPPSARSRLRADAPRFGSSSAPPAAPPKASRRRAPLTLAQAREELGRAGSRNEVLDIFFGFASQFFEYSALFAVHKSLAEGLDAWGKGADRDAVLGVGVPLDLPSSLSEAAESCKVRLTRLGKEGIDRTLAVDLQRQFNGKALLLPVGLRGRCAVLLYADNGEADVVERDIADVIAIAPDVANGLARIILLRKKEARNKSTEASDGSPPPQARRSQPALAAGGAPRPEPQVRAAPAALAPPSEVTRGAPPNAPPPPSRGGVQPQPVVSIGPDTNHVTRARPSAPPPTNPRNGAAPVPSPSGEDPVFLLARAQPKAQATEAAAAVAPASSRATEPAAPASPRATEAAAPASPRATATARATIREAVKVPKPQVAITVPARLEPSRPRLPSVIVEPESADPDASDRATRAAAITRAPTQARSSPPARRPAVPPAAQAPRRAEHDPRSAPTTPPAARHAIDDAPASARGAELPASNASTRGLMPPAVSEVDPDSLEDIGALIGPTSDVWPPPIMDHSPPPPPQPLTALVPIIIADPPKNRRVLKRSAAPGRAGARPSPSSPPGSAPGGASPTVPSPARTRSLEPQRSAVPAPVDVRTLPSQPGRAPDEAGVGSSEAAPPDAQPASGRSEIAAAAVVAPTSETNGASERGPKTLPGAGEPRANPPALRAAATPREPSAIRTGNTVPAGSGGGPATLARERAASPDDGAAAAMGADSRELSAPAPTSPSTPPEAGPPGAPASGESPLATEAPSSSEVQAAGAASAHDPAPSNGSAHASAHDPAPSNGSAPPNAHGFTPSNGSAPASGERRTASATGSISQPAAPRDSGQRLAQRAAGPSVPPPQSGTARAGALAPQPAANGSASGASAGEVSPSAAPVSDAGTRAPASGAKRPSAAPSAPWRPAAWLPASRPPASGEPSAPSRPSAPAVHSEASYSEASAGPASSATRDLARPSALEPSERPAIFPPPPADSAIEELVESICQGDLRAAQELARLGAHSLPQVMARFPGPVVSERPSSRASECGPLLRALATIGSPAMPSITQRSEDPDARVRRWATLLLGEMPSLEACRAVVRRLADDVPRVHQAALDAARLLLAGPAAEAFRDTLFEVAKADDSPLTLRLRTLEHVAKLKDSASVPRLIAFLAADLEPAVAHKALWALTVVTRHDRGRDAGAWTEFWEHNQGRHRVEWLIDALDQGDPRASRAAAEDLREEAGQLFGYSDEQSPEERREVQQKFRTWWQTGAVRRRPSFP